MRYLALISLLMLSLTSRADELIFMTGEKLLRYCSNQENSSMDRGLCEGYLAGLMDTSTTLRYWHTANINFCPTHDLNPFFMRNDFLEWADRHPERLHMAASALLIEIFLKKYPCRR